MRWCCRAAGALALGATALPAMAASAEAALLACAAPAQTVTLPPAPRTLALTAAANAGTHAILVLEEVGRDLEWSTQAAAFAAIDTRPPRLGIAAATVSAGQRVDVRAAQAGAKLRARLHCAPSAALLALPACLARAADLLKGTPGEADAAAGPLCQALQLQAAATRASRQAQPEESLRLYRLARERWNAQGDALREGAAVLGAVEQLARLGRFTEARELAQVSSELNAAAGNRYFALRSRVERCLALRSLGAAAAARRCLEPIPRQMEKIEEWNDAANNYVNLAQFALDDGRNAAAAAALRHAQSLSRRPLAPLSSGALARLRAQLAAREGRVSDALAGLDQALRAYEAAADTRWQANTYLDVAELYRGIGAFAEARLYVDQALRRLPPAQAPARTATAFWLRARITQATGDSAAALADLRTARALFVSLGMSLSDYECALDEYDWTATAAAMPLPAGADELPPRLRWRRDYLSARQALAAGDMAAVENFLAAAPAESLGLDARLAQELLQARYRAAQGHGEQALQLLHDSVDRIERLVLRAQAPALRQMAARRLIGVRRAWLEIVDATAAPAVDMAAAWRLAARTQPRLLAARAAPAGGVAASAFDQALAQELLAPPDSDAQPLAAQRALLALWAQTATAAPAVAVPSLAELQRRLAQDALLLLPVVGERSARVLAISRDSATLGPRLDAAALRREAVALRRLATDPTSATSAIEAAGRKLGERLLPAAPVVPAQLLIVEDPLVSGLAYATLYWPGSPQPLVETTRISLVTSLDSAVVRPPAAGTPVSVFVAAPRADSRTLPPLQFAARETELIRAALPKLAVHAAAAQELSGDGVVAALRREHAWVHVAAHGWTRSGLQGYSGFWLPSVPDGEPDRFVSSLALGADRLRAGLLVLNVCDAAESEIAAGPSTSFAEAASAAGIGDVVAGLWPLSDSAGRAWLPRLYAGAASGDGDVAAALRDAQSGLRRDPHYRHPFHWAALVHFRHGIAVPRAVAADTAR